MSRALAIAVAAQFLTLASYSWLAVAWPDSPTKYLAAVVLDKPKGQAKGVMCELLTG